MLYKRATYQIPTALYVFWAIGTDWNIPRHEAKDVTDEWS